MNSVKMKCLAKDELYTSTCGLVLQRERTTKTPNGNPMGGRWVLRARNGDMLTFNQYRNDIAEAYNLDLGAS